MIAFKRWPQNKWICPSNLVIFLNKSNHYLLMQIPVKKTKSVVAVTLLEFPWVAVTLYIFKEIIKSVFLGFQYFFLFNSFKIKIFSLYKEVYWLELTIQVTGLLFNFLLTEHLHKTLSIFFLISSCLCVIIWHEHPELSKEDVL